MNDKKENCHNETSRIESINGKGASIVRNFPSYSHGKEAQDTTYKILDFKDLDGWERDDHAAALQVFLNTCTDMADPDWASLCAVAQNINNPKSFLIKIK